jgi:hypothetical protein
MAEKVKALERERQALSVERDLHKLLHILPEGTQSTAATISFIDEHRSRLSVVPICRLLLIFFLRNIEPDYLDFYAVEWSREGRLAFAHAAFLLKPSALPWCVTRHARRQRL